MPYRDCHRPFLRVPPALDDTCPRRFREWNIDHGECLSLLPLGDPRWWEVGGWSASCKIIICKSEVSREYIPLRRKISVTLLTTLALSASQRVGAASKLK